MKFANVLCAECNNVKTQPFDAAYDRFCDYVLSNENSIVQHRVIDFAEVYEKGFEDGQSNLYKYFAKLFACDLVANGMRVPPDVRSLIDLRRFLTKLRVTFAVNEDKLILPPEDRPTGFDGLITTETNLRTRSDPNPSYSWGVFFSFLHIYFWYDWLPVEPLGACWVADSRFVYLGYFAPLTVETRDRMKALAAPRWAAHHSS
jgi:hypothetical protein